MRKKAAFTRCSACAGWSSCTLRTTSSTAHWFTSQFFAKIREFGVLLARFGMLAEAEDVFELHQTQALRGAVGRHALAGPRAPAVGTAHFRPIVAELEAHVEALRAWTPPGWARCPERQRPAGC